MSTMAGRMTKFRIDELSGVNRPAQDGARAVFMKRADDQQGEPMSPAIKKALGLAETATDAEVEAAIIAKAGETTATAIAKALEPVQAELKIAKAKAAMTDADKAHMAGKDDAAICKFMDLAPAERTAEIAKAAAGDETCEVEGRTIRKSAVGEDTFAIFKAQAKRLDDQAADIKKAAEATANTAFTKAATEDYKHVAGTVEQRVAVLKAIDAMPTETKDAALAILKAAEGTGKFAFSKAGHGNGQTLDAASASAEAQLKKKAEEIQKADTKLTFAKAYDQAAQENPELYEAALAE